MTKANGARLASGEHVEGMFTQLAERTWFRFLQVEYRAEVSLALLVLLLAPSRAGLGAFMRPSQGRGGNQSSPVRVLSWEQPQAGWLYILDPGEAGGRVGSGPRVILFDPDKAILRGVIATDYKPDMALSPDGTRLYIASGALGRLVVVDTQHGTVIETVGIDERVMNPMLPWVASMAVSPDGRWVHLLKVHSETEYGIVTFDASQGVLLPDEVQIPGCGYARLLPLKGQHLLVHCLHGHDVRMIDFTPSGRPARASSVALPPRISLAGRPLPVVLRGTAALCPLRDEHVLAAVMADGQVFQLDTSTMGVSSTPTIGWDSGWIPFRAWPTSLDRRRLYLGLGSLAAREAGELSVDQIQVVDTSTWQSVGTIKTSHPFWSIAVGRGDRYLYALSPEYQSLLVLDASTLREVRRIDHVGTSPALALVAPG